uniref:laccase n=1 Tax=Ananas comosus var. bracteatus TaxID=296719 RepID=A0A6V7PTR1_ANACO|nr:unnamed protein product [Ananas comosus var. bracteatus]
MAFSFHDLLLLASFAAFALLLPAEADVKSYQFDIVVKNVSGPTIYAREGDRVIINVTNYAQYNMSIHWHGMKQFRNGWADGPAYITQCPIQTGSSYTYDFNVTGQRGTLWWHAHILWLRATVHGAIVVMPKQGVPYPFPQPHGEAELVLGQEWWHHDVEAVEKQGNMLGLPPNMSDAHTINGKPGPLFPCSEKHTYALEVESGKTYLLRIVNAALNDELFFAIAGHNMTVVEIDAVYTKPFATDAILIAPGQTTNVLVKADGRRSVLHVGQTLQRRPDSGRQQNGHRHSPIQRRHEPTLVESHPFHLHGYNFFVVGTGFGNFDPAKDPAEYNLVDPPERNTVGVPAGGWTAIRFRANNPGVWFMHCHLEVHTTWGLKMAFVVEDGNGPEESILPPPKNLPPC